MLLAHGVGTRADLPIPLTYAAIGAGVVLVVSFVGLVALWREPQLDGAAAGRPAGGGLQRFADSARARITLQSAALAVATLVYLIGLLGPNDVTRNATPWLFFITFWVGLVPVSLLLGPVWRVINPLRALHAGLARFLRVDPDGVRAYPAGWGLRPAALFLAVFAWYELCFPTPERSEPAYVAAFMLVYAVVHTSAALWFGREWFARGDGFEVYSTLLGALAPVGRRADRRVVLRSPLAGLDAVRALPGLTAVVVVLVGTTAYDGLSRTDWYVTNIPSGTAAASAMLVACMAGVGLLYLGGTFLATVMGGARGLSIGPETFAHSIVPIAAAYVIAHYFSLFIFDGQNAVILLSDPFHTGLNIFGLNGRRIDYSAVSPRTISLVQICAIVIGHIVAVVVAHDRAVRLLPYREAVRSQVPLLVAMVVLTLVAVRLVLAG